MKIACMVLVLICLVPVSYLGKQPIPDAFPMIRLDKTRFTLGEAVFFWIGVKQTSRAPIPKQYQKTCRLTITRPDGTQKTEAISWPMDGPEDSGWLGGSSLGEDKAQLGRYTLVFEFAGQKTPPTFLFVEDVPILKQIETSFSFSHSKHDLVLQAGRVATPETVTLIVHNGSEQTLRFQHPGEVGSSVSVSIIRVDGSYSNWFFYPNEKLLGHSQPGEGSIFYDEFNWDTVEKVPAITLRRGETYRQELLLQEAFDEAKNGLPLTSGEYKVAFSTDLQILIGERNGQWAKFSPMRISVSSNSTFNIH